jgi:hypothetical protein
MVGRDPQVPVNPYFDLKIKGCPINFETGHFEKMPREIVTYWTNSIVLGTALHS